jgi:hypothetical protein
MALGYRLTESGPIRLLESGSSLLVESSAAAVGGTGTGSGTGTPDPALFPDVVWLLPLSESADADGGPEESFPSPSGPGIACTVTSKKVVHQGYAGDMEIGVTPAIVAFPADPGLKKGDRLLWDGRIIRLLAQARLSAGAGSFYTAQGEIRD